MQPIKFPGSNVVYAENQPEYLPLPAKKEENGDILTCWELTYQEALTISRTRKLFINMKTFNGPLMPILPYIDEPQINKISQKTGELNGKMCADKVTMMSRLHFPFWRSLMFLFFPEWHLDQNVYILDGMMPPHEADLKITHLSYWDIFKRWHYNKFRAHKGGLECSGSPDNNKIESK